MNAAWNLLAHGTPSYGRDPAHLEPTKYSLGFVLSCLPAAPSYHAAITARGQPLRYTLNVLWTSQYASLLTTASALLLVLLVCQLGYSPVTGLLLGLAYGLSTFAWSNAQRLSGDIQLPVALQVALIGVLRLHGTRRHRYGLLAGLAMGWALLLKPTGALFLPPILCFAVWQEYRQAQGPGDRSWRWRAALALALPMVAAGGIALLYNLWRYDTIVRSGYHIGHDGELGFSTPLLTGLCGLLFSSGKGVFWYGPVLLLGLCGLPATWRRHGAFTVLLAALLVTNYVVHAKWWAWTGDSAWGPRFLLATLPLQLLPAAAWLHQHLHSPGAWLRRLRLLVAAALLGLGIAINWLGVVVVVDDYLSDITNNWLRMPPPAEAPAPATWLQEPPAYVIQFVPEFSPLAGHLWAWRLLRSPGEDWREIYRQPPWSRLSPKSLSPTPEQRPYWYGIWWLFSRQVGHPQARAFTLVATGLALVALVAAMGLARWCLCAWRATPRQAVAGSNA